MRIVVCLKQVFDAQSVRVSSRGELDTRDGVRVANPADLCALETALSPKDGQSAEVIALTLGDTSAQDVLRLALAMGADRGILLSDPLFAGSDGAVAYALAQAITCVGNVDLVLAGAYSWDDNGGQVGPYIAELLGCSQITFGGAVEVAGGAVSANRSSEDGEVRVSVPLPAVVTIVPGSNIPRLAQAGRIMTAGERSIEAWDAAAIAADPASLGASGSRTSVLRTFAPEAHARGDVLDGAASDAARALVAHLRQRGLI